MSVFVEMTGTGDPLVLVHGWGLNASVWQPLVQRLADHFELHMLDLPGHGRSPLEGNDFSLASLAEAVLPHLPQRAHWLGWSMGGLLAQYVAVEHAQRLDKLVLVATNAQYVRDDHWPTAMQAEVLGQFAQGLAKDYKATLKRFLAIQALGSDDARQISRELGRHMEAHGYPDLHALEGGLALLNNTRLVDQLPMITQACLILAGRLDTLAPPSAALEMAERMPHASAYIFEHGAHAPFISHPDEFCQRVRTFLQSS
ncbi:MAG: pimeloyl-ACP methyl ester esterase BioH [Gammaproteobacteria bacterium]|nr:pimeloyl-ACP methyl ester esterase BioH [Gammaproteobacteria bacterium]